MNVDTTEGHNKSLEFTAKTVPSGPSKTAASRRIRQPTNKAIAPTPVVPKRSPRKRKIMNYKDFVSGLKDEDHPDLTSPKRKRTRGNLKQPSHTRVAAQKKIQQARTQRLCSPPAPDSSYCSQYTGTCNIKNCYSHSYSSSHGQR